MEDLTEEDDEEEIHLEDPPEAEDAPAKAAQIGHGGAPGLGAVPPPLPPPQPETWTVRFHHHPGDCYFSRALRMLFHHLHILVEIDYVGAERTHPRYTEEWIVSSHILAPDYEHGGTVEMAVHYALLPRATFAAGISDAASQALSVLCHFAGEELDHTVWRHFPRRAPGEMRSAIMGV